MQLARLTVAVVVLLSGCFHPPDNAPLKSETDWAVAVASFAQILKGGAYTGKMTYDDVVKLAEANKGVDPFGYRAEFISLVQKAKVAASQQAQPNGQQGGAMDYPYPEPLAPIMSPSAQSMQK